MNILRRIRNRALVPPAPYAWVIRDDRTSNANLLSQMGPSNAPDDLLAILRNGEGQRFVIKAKSGDTIYIGRIVGDYTGAEPLEDIGGYQIEMERSAELQTV